MACVPLVTTLSLAYVQVVILTTALHGGVELALCRSLTPSSDIISDYSNLHSQWG